MPTVSPFLPQLTSPRAGAPIYEVSAVDEPIFQLSSFT